MSGNIIDIFKLKMAFSLFNLFSSNILEVKTKYFFYFQLSNNDAVPQIIVEIDQIYLKT
jgi:hypothetical protein